MHQRGRDFWCCCPFHQEKTPSCKVDPSTQTWHCFGCGEGGDIFTYICKLDDVSFSDAVQFLARRAGIELTQTAYQSRAHSRKARLKAICAETASFYHALLMRSVDGGAQAARDYLSGRNLGGAIPKAWNLGYAPGSRRLVTHLSSLGFEAQEMIDANVAVRARNSSLVNDRFFNRVMFPINDIRGDVIAFGGRVIGEGEPKYLNSGDTPLFHKSEVLFALDKAKTAMAATGVAIVVEGYTDVIAMHEAGLTNTVATLGTSLTRQHIRILSHHAKKKIIYLFDGDEAGQRAADRALSFIDYSVTPEAGNMRVELCAVTLPDDLDPADFVNQRGKEAMDAVLETAVPLIRYGIDRRLARNDLSTPEGRARAATEALSVLAPIKDSLLAKDYAVYLASKVHANEQDILLRLSELKAPTQRDLDVSISNQSLAKRAPAIQNLSAAERNRLRTEREFLSMCAHNPAMIPDFFNALGQTEWHDKVHRELAQAIMDIAVADPSISVADLIRLVQDRCQYANRILTSTSTGEDMPAHQALSFFAEELAIGDTDAAITAMRAQLEQAINPEEQEFIFQSIVALQKELQNLRQHHISLEQ